MNSSLLREKIQIYSVPTINSDYGHNKDGEPVLKYTTRAHVIFNSQSRVASEGEIYFPTDRLFVVRTYVPVEERDRIYWQDKWWRIVSINPNKYYNNKEIRVVEYNT